MARTAPDKLKTAATFIPRFQICVYLKRRTSRTDSSATSFGWGAADRNAGVGQTARRAGRRQLETGPLHPQPASVDQRGTGAAVGHGNSAHYMGSQSCQKCHAEIYEHWRK